MNEIQLPNMQDLSKTVDSATGFAKMLAEVFPGIAERSLTKANRKATSAMLKDIKKAKTTGKEIGLSDEYIELLCGDIARRYTRNERLAQAAQFALERLPGDFEPQAPIDHEWAENFREHAEKASDEDAQRLWGAILAQEAQEPGTVSKRAMRILADMSKNEALSFKRLCGFATTMKYANKPPKGYYNPFIILSKDDKGNSYNQGALNFSELTNLSSIGLIDRTASYRLPVPTMAGCPIVAGDYVVVLHAREENAPQVLQLTGGVFTECGRELSRICGIGGDPRLPDVIEELAKSEGILAKRFRTPQQTE